jgi:membrane protein DedA with SNARE-associated domain
MNPASWIGALLAAASANTALMPVAIVAGTFILEDAATVAVAVFAAGGQVAVATALVSLYAGIILGDFGLYAIGRLAATQHAARRFADAKALQPFRAWLDARLVVTIFAVRFMPGMRLPTYTASGLFRVPFGRFGLSVILATLVWTTLLFGVSFAFGVLTADKLGHWRWATVVLIPVALFLVGRVNFRRKPPGRDGQPPDRPAAAQEPEESPDDPALRGEGEDRPLSRFEVAPAAVFYFPVAAYWFWLSMRHRGFALPTLANPGITAGGLCGESKTEVLSLLGSEGRARVAPYIGVTLCRRDPIGSAREAVDALQAAGIDFPIVAKPDIGRRGNGVRPIHDPGQLARYFAEFPLGHRVMLQRLVPHEGEAGIFYIRWPSQEHGEILSLTLKYFPSVVGDGHATLRELILRDPRAGRAPQFYLPRLEHRLDRVLQRGETFRLVFTGNHCKGAVFRNGQAFITAAMSTCFDRIAREMPGFYFGRFDVRFESLDALRRGEGFSILEVNGAGSEATHIWDRRTTVGAAYRMLFKQVRIAFEIGAHNRRTGLRPMSGLALLRLYLAEQKLMSAYPSQETD